MLNTAIAYLMKRRLPQIRQYVQNPHQAQEKWFKDLLLTGRNTAFGRQHKIGDIRTYKQFTEHIPVQTYEQIFPYIDRMMQGEPNVLYPGKVRWFAKSSGTTNARSKFIPVTQSALTQGHFRAGQDIYTLYVTQHPDTKLWTGKGFAIAGHHQINERDPSRKSRYGDISAVIMQHLPAWASLINTPSRKVALIDDWEKKIPLLTNRMIGQKITHMAGVPTWIALILERMQEIENKSIEKIWPHLEVFFHGAVSFSPYRDLFADRIRKPTMRYWETYNASEGFFAIQDSDTADEGMLLLVDHGVYYEFVPASEWEHTSTQTRALHQVELGKNYAVIISTNAGLWRYMIGDTIKFTQTNPYRIKITGRTKHYINIVGEEVIVENAEQAIAHACQKTTALMSNFTVAPIYLDKNRKAQHEWAIEFTRLPSDQHLFNETLDKHLRQINSDYDAKRSHDLALIPPVVHAVPPNTFYRWMKHKNKLGGQHKVPRLSNTREYLDEILEIVKTP